MDLPGMTLAPQGARKEALDAIAGLPQDLRELLAAHDGGRGTVGTRPLILWSAEQIAREAESQEVSLATAGLLLFGTDGGGEGYAYLPRANQGRYGPLPLPAAGVHEFEGLGDSLRELLDALAQGR